MIGLSCLALAVQCQTSVPSIIDFEAGTADLRQYMIAALQRALEYAGVVVPSGRGTASHIARLNLSPD